MKNKTASGSDQGVSPVIYESLLHRYNLPYRTEFDANLYAVLLQLSESVRLQKAQAEWLLHPDNADVLNATVYRSYHWVEASHYYKLFDSGRDADHLYLSLDHRLKSGGWQRVLELLDEHDGYAESDNPFDRCRFHFYFAQAQMAGGQLSEALANAEYAQQLDRDFRPVYPLLAELCLRLENFRLSLDWYGKSHLKEKEVMAEISRILSSLRGSSRLCAVKALMFINAEGMKGLRSFLPKQKKRKGA